MCEGDENMTSKHDENRTYSDIHERERDKTDNNMVNTDMMNMTT